eukprot:4066420-Amphidinium_carterae.1
MVSPSLPSLRRNEAPWALPQDLSLSSLRRNDVLVAKIPLRWFGPVQKGCVHFSWHRRCVSYTFTASHSIQLRCLNGNFSSAAEAVSYVLGATFAEFLQDKWATKHAEAVFERNTVKFLIWIPSESLRSSIQGKVPPSLCSYISEAQPPPLPQQVHANAILHTQGTICTPALNLPAVAGQPTLQCTCLIFRLCIRCAWCMQELTEDMYLTPRLLMSCALRTYGSHLAEPFRPTKPVLLCTRSSLRSVGINCLADACHYDECLRKANNLQTAEAVTGGSHMPAAGETFHPRLAVCSAGLTNFHRIHGERQRGRNPLEEFCRDERQKHRRLHESHS